MKAEVKFPAIDRSQAGQIRVWQGWLRVRRRSGDVHGEVLCNSNQRTCLTLAWVIVMMLILFVPYDFGLSRKVSRHNINACPFVAILIMALIYI